MATDYDAPRRSAGDDEESESIEELRATQAQRNKQSPSVDEDEAQAAEDFELPGADLSGEVLEVEVSPVQDGEFTCTSCYLICYRSMRSAPGSTVCRDCA